MVDVFGDQLLEDWRTFIRSGRHNPVDGAVETSMSRNTPNPFLRLFEESRLASVVVFATIVSFGFSMFYNYGYAQGWNPDGIWLLTPGDYFSSSVPAMVRALFGIILVAPFFALFIFVLFLPAFSF